MKTQEEIELALETLNNRIKLLEDELDHKAIFDKECEFIHKNLNTLYTQATILEWVLTETIEL